MAELVRMEEVAQDVSDKGFKDVLPDLREEVDVCAEDSAELSPTCPLAFIATV